jgi:hypothetical protein
MRIAAVHQFTTKKSEVVNLNGSLSKAATHPMCPLRPHDGCKPFGELLIGNLPHEIRGVVRTLAFAAFQILGR